ncbi:MAG: hypothetical protein KC731_42815 [Myxococcales bacterium]|nr:hypothetical protein [Myxococcales bacterium]
MDAKRPALLLCAALGLSACADIAGLGDFVDTSSGAGGMGVAGSGGVGDEGGGGGSGGAGGSGGVGGGTPGAYREAVLFDQPRAYWPFDDDVLPTLKNVAPPGLGAEADLDTGGSDAALWPGLIGDYALEFTTFGAVAVSNFGVLGFPMKSPFSLELWVDVLDTAGLQVVVERFGQPPPNQVGYRLIIDSGELQFHRYLASSADTARVPATPGRSYWVATYDGLCMCLYSISLAGPEPMPDSMCKTSNKALTDADFTFRLGHAAGSHYGGRMDEVAVYPRALDASEVLAHYAASGKGVVSDFPMTTCP